LKRRRSVQATDTDRSAALWMLLFITGCGSSNGPPSPYLTGTGGDASVTFSELELVIIRRELGSLPAEPAPDPSSQFSASPEAAILGQTLFFDPRYSRTGTVSCASCHDPNTGFQDIRTAAVGLEPAARHAASLFNVAYGADAQDGTRWQFWDGRKDSVWSQALEPVENPAELGSTRTKVAFLIYDRYRTSFEAVFGPVPELRDAAGNPVAPETARPGTSEWDALTDTVQAQITQIYVNFGKAVAAYESKLVSRRSRYDLFCDDVAAGATDSDQLSASEKAGLKLFVGKARCISCHLGPNLSDWKFHVTGVAQIGRELSDQDTGREAGIRSVKSDEFNCASEWSDHADKSRCAVNSLDVDASALGAFKTPSLRSASATAPYFHTGAVATLSEVIDFYDRGGDGSGFTGTLDPSIIPLDLSDSEKQQLLDLLNALDGRELDAALVTPLALPP